VPLLAPGVAEAWMVWGTGAVGGCAVSCSAFA